MARRIKVALSPPYPVVIGEGIEPGEALAGTIEPGACAVLTDSNVGPLYASSVRSDLESAGWSVLDTLEIPAGEPSKSLGAYADALRSLARASLGRDGTLFVLGGGVVGDLGGFVAASYLRGVRLVMLPTTLLAMVDSSVGGKVGVDLPEGKNLVGAFHQPAAVVADLDRLATLPEREVSRGLAEVIKMGLLAGGEFFEDLLLIGDAFAGDPEPLGRLVEHSIRYKARIVASDERESGLRAVLNYGHTIGHGLEAASGYALAHGEAVAIGMVRAARIAKRKLGADLVELHEDLLRRADLPTRAPDIPTGEVLDAMGRDKKRRSGDRPTEHRFVLLEEVGSPRRDVSVSEEEVREALEEER